MRYNKKQYKVVIVNDCEDRIYDYLSKEIFSKSLRKKLIKNIEKAIKLISEKPEIYEIIENNKLELKYRKLVLENCVVIYTFLEKQKIVYIVYIYYGKAKNIFPFEV